jgi:hypothetical protein
LVYRAVLDKALRTIQQNPEIGQLRPELSMHVFNELPKAQMQENIEQLLPWNVDKEAINQGWKN